MPRLVVFLVACSLALEGTTAVQNALLVTGTIALEGSSRDADLKDVAVWLTSLDLDLQRAAANRLQTGRFRMLQKNKRFTPHVLMIAVGSVVDFPNADPFFHNVFSMYDGKRFDLGLYEAGTSRSVMFTRPGVCYVFCNIHPDMSAAIVVVDTPLMALSTPSGAIAIPDVPRGRYRLSVWHERYTPAEPAAFPREVSISDGNFDVGRIRLVDTGKSILPHKNKYGRDYNPPQPASPVYK